MTRRRLLAALALVLVVVALNAQSLALGVIHVHQWRVAPVAARLGLECRFTPSCSRYAEIVIARDGVVRGGWKAVSRIARCNPWTARGTVDEP